MLLALSTPSRNMHALPAIVRTLPQAELLHRALVQRVCKSGQADEAPEIMGQDASGKPLRQGHRHAHLLPLDLDGDGHLDHILVWAPMGLGAAAQGAVRAIRQTYTKGGVGDLQVSLAGAGRLEALRSLPASLIQGVSQLIGQPDGARMWTTWTPFVPPRFLKSRGKNTLKGQVEAEIASRGLPAAEVEMLPMDAAASRLRHFVRVRQHGGPPPPMDVGFRLRVTFEKSIQGPLCLGYASHFGLGLFAAER
jgi:CRISPR-associated protein Csb2